MLEILTQAVTQPITVRSTTGVLTAVGIWTGLLGTPMAVLIWWIKGRPRMRELENAQKNTDYQNLNTRILALESKAEEAMRKAHQSDTKLVYVINAFQLVAGELKRLDPNSSALSQAQELLAMASTGDMAMDRAIKSLATVRGVGE